MSVPPPTASPSPLPVAPATTPPAVAPIATVPERVHAHLARAEATDVLNDYAGLRRMAAFERWFGARHGRVVRDFVAEIFGDTPGKIAGKALRTGLPIYAGFVAIRSDADLAKWLAVPVWTATGVYVAGALAAAARALFAGRLGAKGTLAMLGRRAGAMDALRTARAALDGVLGDLSATGEALNRATADVRHAAARARRS